MKLRVKGATVIININFCGCHPEKAAQAQEMVMQAVQNAIEQTEATQKNEEPQPKPNTEVSKDVSN